MNEIYLNKSNKINKINNNNNNFEEDVKYLENNLFKIKHENLILKEYNNHLHFTNKFNSNQYSIKIKNNKYNSNSQNHIHVQFILEIHGIQKIVINNKEINIFNNYNVSFLLNENLYMKLDFYPNNNYKNFKINITNIKYIEFTNKYLTIDKIFIINLKKCHDRKKSMITKLSIAKITNYEFIDAIDANDVIDEFLTLKNNKKTKIINSGHYACAKSHIKVLNKINDSEYNNVLVLEDDVMFRDNFIEKISKLIIPCTDIIYFGGLVDFNKLFIDGWGIHNNIMGMYAYFVNKKIIPNIIKKIETFETYCDVILKKYFQTNAILLNDIIYTNLDDSNTSDKTKQTHNMVENQMKQLI
jgi:hypothetical protein